MIDYLLTWNCRQAVILAVDDSPVSLKLLDVILSRNGYHPRLADSGELALESLNSVMPDLILLDINMPGIDGYEVCRRLKAEPRTRDIPVIFLSADNETSRQVIGFQYGAVDFVTKPFETKILLMRVHTHLELSRLRQQAVQRVAELERIQQELADKNHHLQLTQNELAEKVNQLELSLSQIKRLEGIIPICMFCKKIRDSGELWHQLEQYISDHSDALFSHGMCPECFEKKYGESMTENLVKNIAP